MEGVMTQNPDMSTPEGDQPLEDRVNNRSMRPDSAAFKAFMAANWAPSQDEGTTRMASADFAAARRAKLSARFPGERLVIPAGPLKVRSNDTDYRFRPHSGFAHMTGLGLDLEPEAVLVLEPVEAGEGELGSGHLPTLYFRPMAGRDSEEFYSNARTGEFWIGERHTLESLAALTGLPTKHMDLALEDAITENAGHAAFGGLSIRLVREVDQTVDAVVDTSRINTGITDLEATDAADGELTEALSELRLVKDEWEIEQMRAAVAATANGFDDVIASLPRAVQHKRGERVVEGAFFARAREEGNDLGYETIAASGNHATVLHWIRNDGQVNDGELLLVDAGVEADSLYTADITRTVPVNGSFSEVQARVYQAVLDAADAAYDIVKPGITFRTVHETALKVLAERLHGWGLLPVSVEEAVSPAGQQHRRWMPHGTSHHLGLDVHDCAQARQALYQDGVLEPGMVFTIEPGLYFKAEDLAVPAEYRGIGVRIEDDILVTADGAERLSADVPRTVAEVEAWMARING
jgi:Xaa-Pro aminopeptidase